MERRVLHSSAIPFLLAVLFCAQSQPITDGSSEAVNEPKGTGCHRWEVDTNTQGIGGSKHDVGEGETSAKTCKMSCEKTVGCVGLDVLMFADGEIQCFFYEPNKKGGSDGDTLGPDVVKASFSLYRWDGMCVPSTEQVEGVKYFPRSEDCGITFYEMKHVQGINGELMKGHYDNAEGCLAECAQNPDCHGVEVFTAKATNQLDNCYMFRKPADMNLDSLYSVAHFTWNALCATD